jgi:hypothetical protein
MNEPLWTREGSMLVRMGLPAGDSELVQIVDAALADVARRAGHWLVCKVGCTQCCYGAFAINELDAIRLHEGMKTLRRTDPELAAEIERRAREWIAEHGSKFREFEVRRARPIRRPTEAI